MSDILLGLQDLFSLSVFVFMNLGVLVGIIFGAIPGLTGTIGIILFLPLSYNMTPAEALIFLTGIFCGGEFGGSISAILLGTPGTASAVATLIDGHSLARRGQARKALLMALTASTFGGILSTIVLLFGAPAIAAFTINFGPAEFFSLSVFGLSIISGVSGKSMPKGVFSGLLGVVIALVGIDSMTSTYRFTFGNINLLRGLGMVPVFIGLFTVPSILDKLFAQRLGKNKKDAKAVTMDTSDGLSFAEVKPAFFTMLRSSVIGIIIGAIPGTGTGLAAFLAYDSQRKSKNNGPDFGNGDLLGIAAPEAANNAVTSGALIPLLTMGIPGSPSAAILIGAFMIHGMVPGPSLFDKQGPLMYTLMIGLLFTNVCMYLQGRCLSRVFAMVTKIPDSSIAAVLLVLCSVGAYSVNSSFFDVGMFFAFGAIAYLLLLLEFPLMPIVLGYVLGPTAEFNFRRALVLSEGSGAIFFTRPISLVFLVITAIVLVKATMKKDRTNEE